MVKKYSQAELHQFIPSLYTNLKNPKRDTLGQFRVRSKTYEILTPQSELEKKLLNELCGASAQVIQLQCGREYFSSSLDAPRATQLFYLSQDDLKYLATDNCDSQHFLVHFDHIALTTKYGNRK